jgi:uncharacterized protein (DUF58 family)
LLLWVAAVVLPFSLVAALVPSAAIFSIAAIALLAALVVADAFGARASLAGISVELPEIFRMSKDREAKLELRIRNEHLQPKTVRLGLALPRELESSYDDAFVALPQETEWSRFNWTCVPRTRGRFQLGTVHLETASPFGFWSMRKRLPADSEIRVYPNLFEERKHLAALFLHRGAFGLHAQRQVGKGREFEKLREYVPGDGYDEIHWKATARRGRPITKVFQIERTQEVYVIVDASRLSARSVASSPVKPSPCDPVATANDSDSSQTHARTSTPAVSTALERFVTAALILGLAAEQQGDLFGLLTFSDKIGTFVRAKNGKAHYSACRDALYTLGSQIVTPDFDEVCSFIRLRLRRRALLVFLTSLDDPVVAESFVRNIDLIRHQHLILVNMLQPPDVAPVFTNPNVQTVDDLYQQLGGHLLWQKLRELEKTLQRRGVRFSLLANERLSAELVSQYLSVKQRQLI